MAISAAQLVAIVSVQGVDAARAQLLGMGSAADDAGARLKSLAALGIAAVGIGLAAVGVASVKMAADFQQGITRLKTGAGDMTDNMTKLGQGILAVSTQTGILTNGTDGLNAAMYLIVSSGQRGAQALDTLSVAAKGAQIEQAQVVDVSNALTTAMTDYGTKQFNATQFMNGFIAAVSTGKITLEAMSQAMSPILPVAQKMGVSFADISSAMSTMTDAGMSADRAATGLRFLMQSLEVPTAKASNAFKEWGVNTQDLANEMRVSLPGALQMIYDAAKRAGPEGSQPFNKAISDMIGGQRSLQAFLDLTGTHLQDFEKNSQNVATAMGLSTDAVKGWDTAQTNFNVQLDKAHAALDAVLIQLGTKLLPILTPMVGKIADIGAAFAKWVGNTDFSGLVSTLQGIGTQAGNLFDTLRNVAQFTINSQSWKDAATAIGDASNQVGLFMTRVQQAIDQSPGVKSALADAWNGIGDGVKTAAQGVNVFTTVGNFALSAIQDKALTTDVAFALLGQIGQTSALTVAEAMQLAKMGIHELTDVTTGANIQLDKFAKTADLSGSTTVTLAQALQLVGKNANGFLTAADDAKLLSMNIGNVRDATTGAVTDLKSEVNQTGVYLSLANRQMQQWYDAIKNGSTQTFAQFQADLQNKAEKELKITGATADDTRRRLLNINGPYDLKVNPKQVIDAASTADQTRARLLALNGPYYPIVNASSIWAAGSAAQYLASQLNNITGTYTVGVNMPGHASGITDNPVGHMASLAERGSEWMFIPNPTVGYVPRGASVLPHGTSPSTSGTSPSTSGGQQPIIVNVYLAGAPVAKQLMPYIAQQIRTSTGAKF